jgi:hypothetical protein
MIKGIRLETTWSGPPQVNANARMMLRTVADQLMIVAQMVKQLWIARAQQLGVSDSGEYVRGIDEFGEIRRVYERGTLTSIEVQLQIVNTAKHASIVEDGHAAFHLPSRIAWGDPGKRVKRGKKGPYMHVPFRHGTPTKASAGPTNSAIRNQMPPDIYNRAKSLARTVPQNQGPFYGANGVGTHTGQMFMKADTYRRQGPGSPRLSHDVGVGVQVSPNGIGLEARRGSRGIVGRIDGKAATNPAWKSSKYAGMMKTGQARHTRYITIRTITPTSPGWNIPAKGGRGIARQVAHAITYGEAGRRIARLIQKALTTGVVTLS